MPSKASTLGDDLGFLLESFFSCFADLLEGAMIAVEDGGVDSEAFPATAPGDSAFVTEFAFAPFLLLSGCLPLALTAEGRCGLGGVGSSGSPSA